MLRYLKKSKLNQRILVFTSGLNHPLTSRTNFLVRYLLEKSIGVKVFDFSFYEEQQSFIKCLRSILSFPSRAWRSNAGIIRFPLFPVPGNNRIRCSSFIHFLDIILSFILSSIIVRSLNYDITVCTDPVGALLGISARKPNNFVVYEDLDYFEDLQLGKIQSMFVSFSEKISLRRANLVVSVSKPLFNRAKQLNPNCILVPNGANLQCFTNTSNTSRERVIVYIGSLDEWAGLKLVIDAFPLLKKKIPGLKLNIVGSGKQKQFLQESVRMLSLQDSIFFTGRLSYNQMADLLSSYYIGLAMFKPCNASAFASPLKLFDYMAAGVPIIASDLGDIGRIVKESNAGLVVNWTIDEFVDAVEELLTNRTLWLNCHRAGLRYVSQYDWEILFAGWLNEVQNRAYDKKHILS